MDESRDAPDGGAARALWRPAPRPQWVQEVNARGRMQAWLAARAQDSRRYADRRYDLAQTGFDPETARRRYRAYQDYFGIPSEA